MTREERELSITYLEGIKEKYIEGEGYERHPLPEYYAIETAIKVLGQDPCEDAISRQAVISTIYDNKSDFKNDFAQGFFADKIKGLPPVTIQPNKWIPCSERLPEEDGQYLITVKYKHVDGYVDIYAEHGEWFDRKWDMFFGHCGEVEGITAWMPLPTPYQSEIPTGTERSNKE